MHAPLQGCIPVHGVPWPDQNADMHRASIRQQAKALTAVITNWPDVATLEAIHPNESAHRLHELFLGKGDSQAVHFRRGAKSLQVRVRPENRRTILRVVATDPLEHSRTVVKSMR